MDQDFTSFVERYQIIYEKDPNSKVFAPLAEAYRRMGLLEEAIDLAEKGVKRHPNFASGRVALGKCYAQRGEFQLAVEQLQTAVDLSPENLLAHQLLADCYQKLNKKAEALNAYKMALFLNPQDKRIAENVRLLEGHLFTDSKDVWAEEDFSMEKLGEIAAKANEIGLGPTPQTEEEEEALVVRNDAGDLQFEREVALFDSRMDRGDWGMAEKQLHELITKYPENEEVNQRKRHFDDLTHTSYDLGELIEPIPSPSKDIKTEKLQKLLSSIESRRKA